MRNKYDIPQNYDLEERMRIILYEKRLGHSFEEIGLMMGGVSHSAIRYNYKRYALGIEPKKPFKPKLAEWVYGLSLLNERVRKRGEMRSQQQTIDAIDRIFLEDK